MVDAQKSLHSAQSTRTIKSEHMLIKREKILWRSGEGEGWDFRCLGSARSFGK